MEEGAVSYGGQSYQRGDCVQMEEGDMAMITDVLLPDSSDPVIKLLRLTPVKEEGRDTPDVLTSESLTLGESAGSMALSKLGRSCSLLGFRKDLPPDAKGLSRRASRLAAKLATDAGKGKESEPMEEEEEEEKHEEDSSSESKDKMKEESAEPMPIDGDGPAKVGVGGSVQVCESCHTAITPLWRKGPSGKGTLCNACGTKWARTQRPPRHAPRNGGSPGASQRPRRRRSTSRAPEGEESAVPPLVLGDATHSKRPRTRGLEQKSQHPQRVDRKEDSSPIPRSAIVTSLSETHSSSKRRRRDRKVETESQRWVRVLVNKQSPYISKQQAKLQEALEVIDQRIDVLSKNEMNLLALIKTAEEDNDALKSKNEDMEEALETCETEAKEASGVVVLLSAERKEGDKLSKEIEASMEIENGLLAKALEERKTLLGGLKSPLRGEVIKVLRITPEQL